MIQLKKDDFMWRMYDRFYRCKCTSIDLRDDKPPHPKTVCNLFWKAVGGMIATVFVDSSAWITDPASILFFAFMVWLNNIWPINGLSGPLVKLIVGMPMGIITMISFFWLAAFNGYRWFRYLDTKSVKTARNMQGATIIGIGYMAFSWLMSMTLCGEGKWHLVYLFYGILMTAGMAVAIAAIVATIIVFFTAETLTGKVIRSYLASFKDWVCPLVKAPWEENTDVPKSSVASDADGLIVSAEEKK